MSAPSSAPSPWVEASTASWTRCPSHILSVFISRHPLHPPCPSPPSLVHPRLRHQLCSACFTPTRGRRYGRRSREILRPRWRMLGSGKCGRRRGEAVSHAVKGTVIGLLVTVL